jgi:hypothetical protein
MLVEENTGCCCKSKASATRGLPKILEPMAMAAKVLAAAFLSSATGLTALCASEMGADKNGAEKMGSEIAGRNTVIVVTYDRLHVVVTSKSEAAVNAHQERRLRQPKGLPGQ